MKDLYGFTQNHNDKPGYLNISFEGKRLQFTVRPDGSDGTNPEAGSIVLPDTEGGPIIQALIDPIIQALMSNVEVTVEHFNFKHPPEKLQEISAPFGVLATQLNAILPSGHQKTLMMQRLLEAKDCAVRSALSPCDK